MSTPKDPGSEPATEDEMLCNILIVDDEPSNLLALEAILEPLGQRVVRATSGIEALRHSLRMEFCVVLLDVQMPEMDGLETASLLRRRARTRNVPVIFLTAISKDQRYVTRGYEVGAVDYLFKPYDPDTLRTKVATFVELGRKSARIRAQHEALRIMSQRELAEFKKWSERRYEDLADSMPQIVWTADANGTITYHNQRWEELAAAARNEDWTVTSADELVDDRSSPSEVARARASPPQVGSSSRSEESAHGETEFATIAHPNDLESFVSGWTSAVHAGVPWEAELRLGTAKRGYRFHLVRAIPRRDDLGNVMAWVGTATDIDARVRAERALRMLADASLRLNRSLGRAQGRSDDASMPHELRAVLESALPILGGGAILDVLGTDASMGGEPINDAMGSPTERLRVAAGGVDASTLDDPRFDLGPSTVAYSGRAEVFLDVGAESEAALLAKTSDRSPSCSRRGDELLRFLREFGVGAYICTPLLVGDRIIGTLTFVKLSSEGRYEEDDVDLAGHLARRVAVAIDNLRLHATTERRREELELANKSKDVFLATLSHELRTPLNAIIGWTDMMKRGSLAGDELTRAIDTIDRNAHALSGLVADLLDVSRIVTGTLKLESKYVSLASIAEASVLAARLQCARKEISIDLSVETTEGVIGDPERLRQVFSNLLSNAIKFTPNGGNVSVRIDGDGGKVRLRVADSGEGIDPEFVPHVFERFRQAEPGRAKGLGLGLAIVKHLVEEHGGAVSVTSEGIGKGATFTVELPVARGAQSELEGAKAASPSPLGEPDLAGVHVLVVEDDPDGNELVCTILERYGARVTSATTASAALEALDAERPQVLISDIGLPDMDGIELIKLIRAREGDAALIPAVALTAYASRQDATNTIAAGFDAHVAKPVQPIVLGGVVVQALAGGRKGGLPNSCARENVSSPSAA